MQDLQQAINTINKIIDDNKHKCFTCLYGKKQDVVKGLFIKYDEELDKYIIAIDI